MFGTNDSQILAPLKISLKDRCCHCIFSAFYFQGCEAPRALLGADCRCVCGGSSGGVGPVPSDRGRLGAALQLLLARNKVGVPGSETSCTLPWGAQGSAQPP